MKALIFVISIAILSSIMGCSHQYMNQKTITKDNDLSKNLRLEKKLLPKEQEQIEAFYLRMFKNIRTSKLTQPDLCFLLIQEENNQHKSASLISSTSRPVSSSVQEVLRATQTVLNSFDFTLLDKKKKIVFVFTLVESNLKDQLFYPKYTHYKKLKKQFTSQYGQDVILVSRYIITGDKEKIPQCLII